MHHSLPFLHPISHPVTKKNKRRCFDPPLCASVPSGSGTAHLSLSLWDPPRTSATNHNHLASLSSIISQPHSTHLKLPISASVSSSLSSSRRVRRRSRIRSRHRNQNHRRAERKRRKRTRRRWTRRRRRRGSGFSSSSSSFSARSALGEIICDGAHPEGH